MHHDHNILHRDIKPDNILLTLAGDIKIADLGLACTMHVGRSHRSVLGTMLYASYEKAHGLSYGTKDDIWGFGCVFAELVTRKTLQEWGGAIYEHTNSDVRTRKASILQQ
jgi:serine/threonine protein kinase